MLLWLRELIFVGINFLKHIVIDKARNQVLFFLKKKRIFLSYIPTKDSTLSPLPNPSTYPPSQPYPLLRESEAHGFKEGPRPPLGP